MFDKLKRKAQSVADVENKESNAQQLAFEAVFEAIKEKKTARRYKTVWIILTFIYLTPTFIATVNRFVIDELPFTSSSDTYTARINLAGTISSNGASSAAQINKALREAFEEDGVKGIVLEINSSGGSPVQSAYIYNEIIRLRTKYPDKPIHAVITDIGASGAYFVAAAADKIYVSRSSIVGSIGVRMDSFGAVDLMQRVGVERRLFVAGRNKGILDPFLPTTDEQVTSVQVMLDEVHRHFIDSVKAGRGDRLVEDPDVFTGLVWSGEKAVSMGLADGFGDTDWIARELFAAEDIKDYGYKPSVLRQWMGVFSDLQKIVSEVREPLFIH